MIRRRQPLPFQSCTTNLQSRISNSKGRMMLRGIIIAKPMMILNMQNRRFRCKVRIAPRLTRDNTSHINSRVTFNTNVCKQLYIFSHIQICWSLIGTISFSFPRTKRCIRKMYQVYIKIYRVRQIILRKLTFLASHITYIFRICLTRVLYVTIVYMPDQCKTLEVLNE